MKHEIISGNVTDGDNTVDELSVNVTIGSGDSTESMIVNPNWLIDKNVKIRRVGELQYFECVVVSYNIKGNLYTCKYDGNGSAGKCKLCFQRGRLFVDSLRSKHPEFYSVGVSTYIKARLHR